MHPPLFPTYDHAVERELFLLGYLSVNRECDRTNGLCMVLNRRMVERAP